MKENHTFGNLVFALKNDLQGGNTIPKWSLLSRLGVNLASSPLHACNISLVLNIPTGLVSPQYHVRHDEFLETTCYSRTDIVIPSTWQQLAGLVRSNGDNSLEMNDVVQQGNEGHMPEASVNVIRDMQDQHQVQALELMRPQIQWRPSWFQAPVNHKSRGLESCKVLPTPRGSYPQDCSRKKRELTFKLHKSASHLSVGQSTKLIRLLILHVFIIHTCYDNGERHERELQL